MQGKYLTSIIGIIGILALTVFLVANPIEQPEHDLIDTPEVYVSNVTYERSRYDIFLRAYIENPTSREVRGKLEVKGNVTTVDESIVIAPYGTYIIPLYNFFGSIWSVTEVHIFFRDNYLDVTYIDEWIEATNVEVIQELIYSWHAQWEETNGSLQAHFNIRNSNLSHIAIVEVKVDNETVSFSPQPFTLNPDERKTLVISMKDGFAHGNKYEFSLISERGFEYTKLLSAP